MVMFLIFSILLSLTPTSSAQNNDESILKLETVVDISFDDENLEEPLIPGGDTRDINVSIEYKVQGGKILGNFLIKLFSSKTLTLELNIIESPDWLTVDLDEDSFEFDVSNETLIKTLVLSVSASSDAPAYEEGDLKFNATVEPKKGPLGILTLISGFYEEYKLSFEASYAPSIDIKPESTTYTISPYNETEIPISITNLGNDKTTVMTEIVNQSENWNVSISDITIDIDETGTAYLKVYADHKFDQETIKIKFTPARKQDTSDKGESQIVTLLFENDGSYKEPEEEFEIDTTMLAAILLVILLVIIVIIVFLRKK